VSTTVDVGRTAEAFLTDLEPVIEEIRAGAAERDRARTLPVAEIVRLREIGFWSLTVPVEHGGLGLGPDALIGAVMRIATADGSLGQIPQNHFMAVERFRLATAGAQREHWLRTVGDGAVFGNATAEPGEPAPNARSTEVRCEASGWRLTGRKVYSTGSLLADFVTVTGRSEDGGVRNVLVRPSDPGVILHDDWTGLGQRTTASGTSEFHDVAVDDIAVLAESRDPVAIYRVSALGQLLHAAIDAGIAQGATREAVVLAGRTHGGRGTGASSFADDTLGVALLGELHVTTLAARSLVESAAAHLAELTDDSPLERVIDCFYEVAAAKVQSGRAALEVTMGLFDVGGASSTRPDLGLDRFWRDARTHTLHDAARQKPHSIGRWLIAGDVADPWSIGHPMRHIDELRSPGTEADRRRP
jgi:alkylation response protein AidB-like acyl-CoA dehydrogenase